MSFQSNNFGGNSNNQQDGDKKRTNFRLGRFYGSDGILDLSIWISNSAVYTIFQIKSAVGKDPSSGMNVYENKAPAEIPRVFMNPEWLRALLEAYKAGQDTIDISPKKGSRFTAVGINGSQIKITITEEKHPKPREITFDAIPVGNSNVQNSNWKNMMDILQIALKKALTTKLNPDEFGEATSSNNDDELPI
ncbi:MAG: hypothetical protein J5614_09715 [Paludibacteraceae bacterium]|nr:hypothetical protein [Paludibacteraceae bacterium]